MNIRFGLCILPLLASLLLAFSVSCSGADDTQLATLPPEPPLAEGTTPLTASEQESVDKFVEQKQAIDQEWDRLHQEFDHWRAGLTDCHRNSVHESLQGFAASFTGVTEGARNLPRTSVTRELADILIAAAEEEEAAFRQLRDRWQPNNVSLFELVEQRRNASARAQKEAEDRVMELQEEFEEYADPEVVRALEEFSDAFQAIREAWNEFHNSYTTLQREADNLDNVAVLTRLGELIRSFGVVVEDVYALAQADSTEDMIEKLQEAAQAELEALFDVSAALQSGGFPAPTVTPPGTDPVPIPGVGTGQALALMDTNIKESEAVLREVSQTIKALVASDPAEKLEDIRDFNEDYGSLLVEWDAFHQDYSRWRETEGGCDRTGVLQALDRFNLRVGELGRMVRDLPQSSYLLPMYTLLVQAVEREEGAFRALSNSWRPFAVDTFKAVDQERVNSNRLRRQADIGLQGLRDRS